jgi:Zn-finger nucleic acid-binding protein
LTLTEAGVLKDILERALVGWTKDLPEAPSTPLNDPEAWTPATDESAPRCPRCQTPSLTRVGGELDEMRCTTCDGRFISAHGTERLIEGELGLDRDLLRDLEGFFSGERLTCPSCRSKMSPMRIKGEHVDLCTGCGGFWFDAGELASVSQGRYAVDVGQGSSDGDG